MSRLLVVLGLLGGALSIAVLVMLIGPGVRYVTSDGAEVTVRRDGTTVVYPQGKGPLSAVSLDGTEKRILVTVEGCAKVGR